MPNKNYQKGRRKEYGVCDKLKRNGWDIVQRSSGSHSPIDIFAINKETKEIKFIQVKAGGLSNSESVKLYEEMKWLNGKKFDISFDIED